MIHFLGLSQNENTKNENCNDELKNALLENTVNLYKIIMQEENLYNLAKEQKEIIKDKDSVIERLLAEREQQDYLNSLLNERISNKDKYIEQLEKVSKKRNISVIGFAGYGMISEFKFSPVIGVGIGIEIFKL